MKHIHLDSVDSTQNELKKHLEMFPEMTEVLISTEKQLSGRGRENKKWLVLDGALAFSFLLAPNTEITLSTLEIGLLISDFFESEYQSPLMLKWPNDLMTIEKIKCGGILTSLIGNQLLVGVGINLFQSNNDPRTEYAYQYALNSQLKDDFKKTLPAAIYAYLLKNRLSPEEVIKRWNEKCCHLNMRVEILDRESLQSGVFNGIGARGEALIDGHPVYSGSLTFFNN